MDEEQEQVRAILRSPRIKDRLVVLCEGERLPVVDGRAPSPQMYRCLEKLPDSSFYKACVPKHWHGVRLPHFFNCGGRSNVVQTFEALLQAHYARPDDSYLTPEKLYALVDLDLQVGQMPVDYPWSTTEDVHELLYKDGALRLDIDPRHRIWVTALVHKEAFFVLPGTAVSWANNVAPFFAGAPLDLRALYTEAARRLAHDVDVALNITRVKTRLDRFAAGPQLDCSCADKLAASWLTESGRVDGEGYEPFVRALLAVAKVKSLWNEIVPDPNLEVTMPAESFRDQLALKVAGSIAKMPADTHPLAGFFAWLKPRR